VSSRAKHTRKVGLARALSKLGYCSRSQAREIICAGRVTLNGRTRRDPQTPVRLEEDEIRVEGRPLDAPAKVYLMLNKPRGVVTTASDEKGRDTVYAYVGEELPWVAPVGRLDKASEGLLLLSNDSEWAAKILAPATHLDKTYHVQVGTVADSGVADSMRKGVKMDDGDFLRVKSARILRGGQRNTWLEVLLDEGKNRHIRRLLGQLGVEILRLVRVAIGPLALGDLPKGSLRPLTADEKQALDRAVERCSSAIPIPSLKLRRDQDQG
jgi:23S rRNA pseudouridine2605 synthase